MRSTLKLTLTALAVSVALTGCKSTEGTRVVEKPKAIQTQAVENPENPAKVDGNLPLAEQLTPTATPNEPEKPTELPKTEPVKPTTSVEQVNPTISKVKEVNTDSTGQYWRVIRIATQESPNDASRARLEDREHFVLPSSEEHLSPFVADEDDKAHNFYLELDLGTQDKAHSFVIPLQQADANYLGKHEGSYKDSKLEGKEIVRIDEDGEAVTQNVDAINYLYFNQPYSSYGALYTNENDSNLFHIRLSTGRDGQRKKQDDSSVNFAEYGVFTYNNGIAQWNEGLVGEASYKGNVIARVERTENGKTTVTAPQLDGDVTLTLNLNNDWAKNKLYGEINSKALGTIQLTESTLADPKALRDSIGFHSEHPTVKDKNEYSGFYATQFVGEKLNDVVGTVELTSDNEEGITKYNAVFGGTKQ